MKLIKIIKNIYINVFSFKQSPSYLLLRRSRPCGRLWLIGSIHCSPGISRIQRLTCLHGGLAELVWWDPLERTLDQNVRWTAGTECVSGTERGGSGSLGPLRFPHVARVTLLARCDFQGSLRYFSEQSAPLWRFFLQTWFQVVIVSHIVYLCLLEHASYCLGSVQADLMEK